MSKVGSNVLNIGKDIKTMTRHFKMKKMGPPKPTPIPTPARFPLIQIRKNVSVGATLGFFIQVVNTFSSVLLQIQS